LILVTGATGKVGREVVRQLAAAGAPVRALVRDPVGASPIRLPGVEIVIGDLAQPGTLAPALAGIERVFLLTPAHRDMLAYDTNVVDAAAAAGARRIVTVSVAGGPDSGTQIGRWHWAGEKKVESSGLDFTFLRPSLYMQQALVYAKSIASSGTFSAPLGTGAVALVDARDVAAVAVRALTEDGHSRRIYDLTGPEAITFDELADAIGEAIGRSVSYVHVAPEYALKQMLSDGVPRWIVDDMLVLFASFREGYGAAVSDAIPRILGRPAGTIRQFASDYAQAFRAGR
jgi:uncharacterized protein YbjT (DUF2867 family)